jgi:hypothetical protein
MHRLAKRWFACAWIAVLAVLFNALAPVVSHTLSHNDDVARADICSVMGVAMTAMPAMPGHAASDKLIKGMTDCGYCATHAGSFGLPPVAGLDLVLFDTHDSLPFLFFHAPHPLPVWTAPQSRAPPFFA